MWLGTYVHMWLYKSLYIIFNVWPLYLLVAWYSPDRPRQRASLCQGSGLGTHVNCFLLLSSESERASVDQWSLDRFTTYTSVVLLSPSLRTSHACGFIVVVLHAKLFIWTRTKNTCLQMLCFTTMILLLNWQYCVWVNISDISTFVWN